MFTFMSSDIKAKIHPLFTTPHNLFFLYLILIIYLVYGTGVVSDDFNWMARLQSRRDFLDILIPIKAFASIPIQYYSHVIFYYFADLDHLLWIGLTKIVYVLFVFCMTTQFFSIFLEKLSAMIVAFLFTFFPSHDSTTYWYLGQYLDLSTAIYLYAYYQAHKGRFVLAVILAVLASLHSYGSAPVAFALFILFVLKHDYKKGLILWVPNVLYCIYFLIIELEGDGPARLPDTFSMTRLIKQLILQVGTFMDAAMGPSFFLKLYYSIQEISSVGIVVAVLFIAGYYGILKARERAEEKVQYDKQLVIALGVLTLGSLGMFALTGFYPQLAFNLGNRTTTFGSLLLVYLIVTMPIAKGIRYGVLLILLFAIVGISSHWKSWHLHQMEVIDQIRNNKDLMAYSGTAPIYVTGNQYSQMGPLSHIEFMSEHWVVGGIFHMISEGKLSTKVLNKRFVVENQTLIDKKYRLEFPIEKNVMVYDSEADRFFQVETSELNHYIASLPDYPRHWVQLIQNKKINEWIVMLMPRLKYTF